MTQRKIKFRAWDKEKKEIKQVNWLHLRNEKVSFECVNPLVCGGKYEDYEIMQFTGLKDKNGKEIYEGDIVVIPNMYPFFDYPEGVDKNLNATNGKIIGKSIPNYRGVIEWVYSQWQVILNCVNPKKRGISDGINEGLNDEGIDEGKKSKWKVIGDIYSNPELLKE